MLRKRIQLGLIHVALTITLLPINSTLNRIMITELALSATLVAILASLPYLFSPIQVAIGSFSDNRPIFGFRRTPYIIFGLAFCVVGVIAAPYIAFLLADNFVMGIILGVLAFGAWGMGYNFATVAYFSLATELSGEEGRGRTIATMFTMMIISIIITSIALGRLLDPYSPEALISSFRMIGFVALAFGLIGVFRLESRSNGANQITEQRFSWNQLYREVLDNRQAMLFFRYLILMLVAILGQDILLEPFGAEAFGLSVAETTRITSIWGAFFLVTLILGGMLEKRISKLSQARIGAWSGMLAFLLIIYSGISGNLSVFYAGVITLGLATGLATVSNLSLMLDMTTAGKVGMFMGVWGMANAFSRLTGNLLGGLLRDVISALASNPVIGYSAVFAIEMLILAVSLVLLRSIDVSGFQKKAKQDKGYLERAAIASDS
jgi:BCD family chlorophyll transporter-like MFS transporter